MPTRVWSHLCDYATVDASGKPLIIGEFDRINVRTNLPLRWPLLFVTSKWNGHTGEQFTYRVRITTPGGEELALGPEENVTIGGEHGEGNHVSVGSFMMLEFGEFGEYLIELFVDNFHWI